MTIPTEKKGKGLSNILVQDTRTPIQRRRAKFQEKERLKIKAIKKDHEPVVNIEEEQKMPMRRDPPKGKLLEEGMTEMEAAQRAGFKEPGSQTMKKRSRPPNLPENDPTRRPGETFLNQSAGTRMDQVSDQRMSEFRSPPQQFHSGQSKKVGGFTPGQQHTQLSHAQREMEHLRIHQLSQHEQAYAAAAYQEELDNEEEREYLGLQQDQELSDPDHE